MYLVVTLLLAGDVEINPGPLPPLGSGLSDSAGGIPEVNSPTGGHGLIQQPDQDTQALATGMLAGVAGAAESMLQVVTRRRLTSSNPGLDMDPSLLAENPRQSGDIGGNAVPVGISRTGWCLGHGSVQQHGQSTQVLAGMLQVASEGRLTSSEPGSRSSGEGVHSHQSVERAQRTVTPGVQSTMDEETEEGGPPSKTTLSGEHGRHSRAKRRKKEKSPEQQERADSPGPSCVSMKSDWSMDRPVNFKDGNQSVEKRRVQQERADSPGPSCVSMKSDWSMDNPANFKDGSQSIKKRTSPAERADSPGPSCVSMKSDWSMDNPVNFKDGSQSVEKR
ncbi:hypothetical protein N1851_002994 [Merluccius polli]|uniref:Uncharacterized protein n=1 Tax=Merluccius polli TaxID=89951 RepID=A0AA47NA39_MERPO|nr:hypothetical protein N1851_002994 [Merluccius polli]